MEPIGLVLILLLLVGGLAVAAWRAERAAEDAEAAAERAVGLPDRAPEGGPPPRVLVRVYRAPQQSDATAAFQRDAAGLAGHGYRPVSQSWAQGQWGSGAWLIALLLCIVLIGLFVFIYMLIVKPDGTLNVTYELADAVAPQPLPPAAASVRERLAQLDDLRAAGVISEEEYTAKRATLIDAL